MVGKVDGVSKSGDVSDTPVTWFLIDVMGCRCSSMARVCCALLMLGQGPACSWYLVSTLYCCRVPVAGNWAGADSLSAAACPAAPVSAPAAGF